MERCKIISDQRLCYQYLQYILDEMEHGTDKGVQQIIKQFAKEYAASGKEESFADAIKNEYCSMQEGEIWDGVPQWFLDVNYVGYLSGWIDDGLMQPIKLVQNYDDKEQKAIWN